MSERARRFNLQVPCLVLAAFALAVAASACGVSQSSRETLRFEDSEVLSSTVATEPTTSTAEPGPTTVPTPVPAATGLELVVDPSMAGPSINPLIRGVAGPVDPDFAELAGTSLQSWGGTVATRFNYESGNASNSGRESEFRNIEVGTTADAARDWIATAKDAGQLTRFAVPTLGWVAKDADQDTCSYPLNDGGCRNQERTECSWIGDLVADPETTSVQSTPRDVAEWLETLGAEGLLPDIVSFDNEPDVWPLIHYDVHPECTTFEEILERHINYTSQIGDLTAIAGPSICCWFSYWGSDPGPAGGTAEEFIPWFLRNVREHDEAIGSRTLHMLDVHFHPQQDGIEVGNSDELIDELRLRSTRSLWDPSYVDESWLDAPITFIPRMQSHIDVNYPDTGLMISEWSFGGYSSISGAIAATDALAIFGREGVNAAAISPQPEAGSPGSMAFALHGNYDGNGSSFSGRSIPLTDFNPNEIASYAAVDTDGTVRVLLLNKTTYLDESVQLQVEGYGGLASARLFHYSATDLTTIVPSVVESTNGVVSVPIPPMSITLIELPSP